MTYVHMHARACIHAQSRVVPQVILALHDRARGVKIHIPYRNSLMTSVLRDRCASVGISMSLVCPTLTSRVYANSCASLGGNSRTVFITTLNTESDFVEESMSTCRFAQRCSMLSHNVELNEARVLSTRVYLTCPSCAHAVFRSLAQEMDLTVVVARLKKENEELRARLEAATAGQAGALLRGAPVSASAPASPSGNISSVESKHSSGTVDACVFTCLAVFGCIPRDFSGLSPFRELSQEEIVRCEEKVVQYLHFNPGTVLLFDVRLVLRIEPCGEMASLRSRVVVFNAVTTISGLVSQMALRPATVRVLLTVHWNSMTCQKLEFAALC